MPKTNTIKEAEQYLAAFNDDLEAAIDALRTGQVDEFPHNDKHLDIHTWYATHDWVLDAPKIAKLRTYSDRNEIPVFLCGVASGDDKAWPSFNAVFCTGHRRRNTQATRPRAQG